MAKRRRKFRKPRHRMSTTFDGGKGWHQPPLNKGEVKALVVDTPKVGPLDLNTSTPSVHHNKGSRLIHPPPGPGYIRPPSTLRAERGTLLGESYVPTRFLGTAPGRYETENRSKKLQARVEPMFKFLFKGETRQARLWFTPSKNECIIVETDSLVGYRKESIVYTSLATAEAMYCLGKVSWVETKLKQKAD